MDATVETDGRDAVAPVLGGVIAYLQVDGALKAAEFYRQAFGAEIAGTYPPDEKGRTMHVHLYINGSSVMLTDAFPDYGYPHEKAQGFTMMLQVEDIDAWWKRAVDAGITVVKELEVMFWGDRYGQMKDAFGITWAMNSPVRK